MIFGGEFVTGIDLVDVSLWTFTIFFLGLIFYLRREDRREGYPLEEDTTGKQEAMDIIWFPPARTFNLSHGRGSHKMRFGPRDERSHALKQIAPWAGAPYAPTGDPMTDQVGPASYAEREDVPDITDDGRPRIAPFRLGDGFSVAKEDLDPRGLSVVGADGEKGGEVVDIWGDRSEAIIRYLEVKAGDGPAAKKVLLPITFAKISKRNNRVEVDAILGGHFAKVPTTKSPDTVTRLEEDKITGFYGGGKLYATPER